MMKQSTSFAQVATNLLNVLQGYSKTIRLLLVMFLTLCVSANVWGAEVTLNISDYASANNWTNGTAYSSANINTHLTATKGGAGDNGKYYTSNSSWRFYEANNGSITISTNSGTLQSITFTYSKSNNGVLKYNNNGISSGTACSVSGTSATFTVSHSSGTKNGNVQITSITITYTPAASCDKKVTVNKGTPSNGSFSISKTGTYETCDAPLVITLSNITPSAGYQFGAITQTGIGTGVTIDQANKTVTYAKNTSGASTINVTFEQKQSATITLSEAGVETGVTGKYIGDSYTLPSTTSQSCGDLEFVGWSTVEINNSAEKPTSNFHEPGASVTLAADQTFYAVFAEGSGDAVETSIAGGDWSNGATSEWTTHDQGAYSNNGVKFDSTSDYVLSPNIATSGYTELLLKFKAGYNGSQGSVLTIYAYDKELALLSDDQVTISPSTVIPDVKYTEQTKTYQVSISAKKTIGQIMIQMTSRTSNLGMKYCELFAISSQHQNYTTQCSNKPTVCLIHENRCFYSLFF